MGPSQAGDNAARRPSLLVFAYACGPGTGSEYGAGWGMVTSLNEFADLVVLTGSKHIGELRNWEEGHPSSGIHFVEVADRRLGRFMRWNRIPEFLLYLLWLRKAGRQARREIARRHIDAACHVTFSTYWLPTPATSLGLPAVWGPVGGAVTTPRPLWSLLGKRGVVQELMDLVAVRLLGRLPPARRTARLATARILQNQETLAALPAELQDDSWIVNHALFSVVPSGPAVDDGRYALWVSPMEIRKGPQLALRALARTKTTVPLVMIGDGPQRRHLERLAEELGLTSRVRFTGWVDRSEAVRLMRGATTILFTGLREEGGLALAEAMHSGRRLIVLDHGGAGAIARRATDASRVALVAPGELEHVAIGFAEAIDAHLAASAVSGAPLLDRSTSIEELRGIVMKAIDG